MPKLLSILSLIVSVAAIAIAAAVYLRADVIADQAVQRREQQIVEQLKPKVHAIYSDFDMALPPSAVEPKSLDDLFSPMFRLVTDVQEGG